MIRTIVKLAFVAVLVNAAVHVGPVYWNYFKFKDAVQEIANFSSRRTESEVVSRVVAKAQNYDIPVTAQDVKVRKVSDRTFVETSYTADLEYFPRRSYPVTFDLKIEGKPPRFEGFRP
jgi:hypothetical protein